MTTDFNLLSSFVPDLTDAIYMYICYSSKHIEIVRIFVQKKFVQK